ncbi:MAG TPA: PrsW family glutamic-type intramembrane protease [Candidatus Ozemobacteraceae bacterium]|nr:PrsW family glutamic-type intramembrane protease [Candidatus Ozemobacteraceae bacterium]
MLPFLVLTILSIAPIVMFFRYLRYMDRAEPEPVELVMKVMKWGAMAIVPVVIVEVAIEKFAFGGPPKDLAGIFLFSFLGIAAVEELGKLLAGLVPVWNDPNFNEENDGIVYVSAASLGFAGVENFFYVLDHGAGVGVLRAVLSVPGHLAWGAMMGYYAGLAKFAPPEQQQSLIVRGYLYAVFGHGLYDAFLLSQQPLLVLIMFLAGPVYIWKTLRNLFETGRRLSLQRIASHGGPPVVEETEEPVATAPSALKLYVARLIYTLAAGFWALILLGLYAQAQDPSQYGWTPVQETLLGTVILTAFPLILARFLSSSYWRQARKFQASRPAPSA